MALTLPIPEPMQTFGDFCSFASLIALIALRFLDTVTLVRGSHRGCQDVRSRQDRGAGAGLHSGTGTDSRGSRIAPGLQRLLERYDHPFNDNLILVNVASPATMAYDRVWPHLLMELP